MRLMMLNLLLIPALCTAQGGIDPIEDQGHQRLQELLSKTEALETLEQIPYELMDAQPTEGSQAVLKMGMDLYFKNRKTNSPYRVYAVGAAQKLMEHGDSLQGAKAEQQLFILLQSIKGDLANVFSNYVNDSIKRDLLYLNHFNCGTVKTLGLLVKYEMIQDRSHLYQIGSLLHSEGVNQVHVLVENSDADMDEIMHAQERATNFLLSARPFLMKSCQIDPHSEMGDNLRDNMQHWDEKLEDLK